MNTLIVSISAFLLCFLGFWTAWAFSFSPNEEIANQPWLAKNLPFFYKWAWFSKLLGKLSQSIGMFFIRLFPADMLTWLIRHLKAAGVKMPVEMFVTSQTVLAAMILPIYFLYMFIMQEWIVVLPALILGALLWVCPLLMVYEKAQNRQQAIVRALPFAIDLIGSAMRSGQDFMAAIRFYVRNEDATNPLVQEFSQVLQDMSGGLSREEAMNNMADRVQVESFTIFVSAVIHGEKVGASIVQTLKNQGGMLRRERFAIAQQKAEKADQLLMMPCLVLALAFFIIILYPVISKFKTSFTGF